MKDLALISWKNYLLRGKRIFAAKTVPYNLMEEITVRGFRKYLQTVFLIKFLIKLNTLRKFHTNGGQE